MDREEYLMSLLGFSSREQLVEFLNSPDTPTGNMVPPGQIEREMQILEEGKEEIHALFRSLDGQSVCAIDAVFAEKLITEERASHDQKANLFREPREDRNPQLAAVYRAAESLTEKASAIGLGAVTRPEDLFRVERAILNCSPHLRTPKEHQFLTRMRAARAAAQDYIANEEAEATASKFRADAENASQGAFEEPDRFPRHSEEVAAGAQSIPLDESIKLPPSSADAIVDEHFIKGDRVEPDPVATQPTERPATPRSNGSNTLDNTSTATFQRDRSGIRAIRNIIREAAWMLGIALGWVVPPPGSNTLKPISEPERFSISRTWPLLTAAGVATAWYFSPFNAFPAVVLLVLALSYGFNLLKRRVPPVFLRSALLFMIIFVSTGIIHDEFFDRPTAMCSDGTYSYSRHQSGACSWHEGVARWRPRRKHWWQNGAGSSSSGTVPVRRSRQVPVSPLGRGGRSPLQ